jgi:alpha-galactosidase
MTKSTPSQVKNTEISFYKSGERQAARYVSAATVYEEALQDSRWIGLYWSASGQVQRENITSGMPGFNPLELPLHTFDIEIDGQDLRNRWELASTSERIGKYGTREAVVELRHQLRPVTIKVVTRLDGTPFLARYIEITNTGTTPAALSRLSPCSGMLWTWAGNTNWGEIPQIESTPFELGYFDSCRAGSEGNFKWEDLPIGSRRIESNNGHSGFGNPFIMVRNKVTGESAIVSLAWSGNWYAELWNDPDRNLSNQPERGINLAFRMGPGGPAPLRVLDPGETITTPETHIGLMHGSTDEIVAAWHSHLRASVIPPRPKGKEMFTYAGRVVEEKDEWIHREIDIAAEMGVEAFMVDAGWYGDEFSTWWERVGDWKVGDWLPGGLAACRELCKKHGMLFGLWMEPERVGPKSNLLKEHPEWLLHTDGNREAAQMLDLANPDAAKFMQNEIIRVIREHQLDFFKIDYNCRVYEGGQHERHGYAESELWRHYETLYATFDQVLSEMPQVALECCASGGGRNDLGMMSRMHYCCESDFSMFPRSIRAINGLTLFLPPESLCYYHNHMPVAHQKADLDTHLRVTLFAQPIHVGFGAQDADRTTEYFQKTRKYIELHKNFCRPVIGKHPVVYHHTPDIGLYANAPLCVLEYGNADKSRGYVGVFRLKNGADEYLLRPRGVDTAAEYEVILDNSNQKFRISGRELAFNGLPIRLESAMTSELVMYKKI